MLRNRPDTSIYPAEYDDRKLLIIPIYLNALGGTTVSLAMLARGFQLLGLSNRVKILIHHHSLMEQYFEQNGLSDCVEIIEKSDKPFFKEAMLWVSQQPRHWPLLLDNSVHRFRIPKVIKAALPLRLSGRPVYHFCHDLALSHNTFGFLARKLAFFLLSPRAICNSHFTARHIKSIMPDICGILYQPVDLQKISQCLAAYSEPPENLRFILDSGAKVILTPSRLNKPGIVNDKNLRALPPLVAALKERGYHYHSVVIGADDSENKLYTKQLLDQAKALNVLDRFTILPPTFEMENYYKYADIVVTMAPREPFGRTVVEAIAHGVPVVGSNTGGINEILQNFAPGWTVDPNDSDAAATKIIQIHADQTETQGSLIKGQKWIEKNCSAEHYASGMMELVGLLPS